MERVKGIGGIFFKSGDPGALAGWYQANLGVNLEDWGGAAFPWHPVDEPTRRANTIWSVFPVDTKYFQPGTASFMVNFRVDNLDKMLAQLEAAGVTVDPKRDESEFGRFGWVLDPDGNRIELWEPPAGK